jgi:hypothetical protein
VYPWCTLRTEMDANSCSPEASRRLIKSLEVQAITSCGRLRKVKKSPNSIFRIPSSIAMTAPMVPIIAQIGLSPGISCAIVAAKPPLSTMAISTGLSVAPERLSRRVVSELSTRNCSRSLSRPSAISGIDHKKHRPCSVSQIGVTWAGPFPTLENSLGGLPPPYGCG